MKIAVFCGASEPHNEHFTTAAQQLGKSISACGHTLVYGGSNLGLMGTVSSAALQQNGYVVAIIPTLFSDKIINSQKVSELIKVRNMAERKERMLAMCDMFVALPGGIGTIDEVVEVMVANQLKLFGAAEGKHIVKPVILLNIDSFFDNFISHIEHIKAEGLMRSNNGMAVCGSVSEAMACIEGKVHTQTI